MFCCNGSYKQVEYEINGMNNKKNHVSTFPGMLRKSQNGNPTTIQQKTNLDLVQSGGNALMEYSEETMSDLIKVTVPSYCQPGQMIEVVAPDGSDRVADTVIPQNCGPGSTFLMKFLPLPEPQKDVHEEENQHDLALREERNDIQPKQIDLLDDAGQEENKRMSNNTDTQSKQIDLLNKDDAPEENVSPLEEKLLPLSTPTEKHESTMTIYVPNGIIGGSIIYTRVPGSQEERYLPVQVPEDSTVPQFCVSYVYAHTVSEHEMLDRHPRSRLLGQEKNLNDLEYPAIYVQPLSRPSPLVGLCRLA